MARHTWISRRPAPMCSPAAAPRCSSPARGTTGETVWNNGANLFGAWRWRSWRRRHQRAQRRAYLAEGHRASIRSIPAIPWAGACPTWRATRTRTTGYVIQVDGQQLTGVGGTSAVSPLWAALIARINQHLGKPAGYLNPILYSQIGKTAAFHDVTSGSNDPTGGQLGGYNTGPGWDACTGWGSPDGTRLLNALDPGSPITPGSTSEPINPVRRFPGRQHGTDSSAWWPSSSSRRSSSSCSKTAPYEVRRVWSLAYGHAAMNCRRTSGGGEIPGRTPASLPEIT